MAFAMVVVMEGDDPMVVHDALTAHLGQQRDDVRYVGRPIEVPDVPEYATESVWLIIDGGPRRFEKEALDE